MRPQDHTRKPDPQTDAARQTRSLAALAFALALVIICLVLVQTLRRGGQIEDCLLAARINCDRLVGTR